MMGKKGNWFSSLKRTLSPSSKQKKTQISEKNESVDEHPLAPVPEIVENVGGSSDSHPFPPPEEVKPMDVEADLPQATISVAAASTAATTRDLGGLKEEVAAIRIQTVFRGYLAKRALWGLRGLVRLKTVVEGSSVRCQTANTLKCTQNLSHIQSQINSRRIRMSEENQALQRQLRARDMLNLQKGDEWNDNVQSKEEMEAKLLSKYEATMRRERAMAYSLSHQQPWKKGGATNMLFMDPPNPQWGWSWSERYKAQSDKDPTNDNASVKSGITITKSKITKSYARHQLNSAPTTPCSKAGGGPLSSRKPKPSRSSRAYGSGGEDNLDDDSKSVVSVKSEMNRRHSEAGSGTSKSAKVKPRGQGVADNGGGSAKKHRSFQAKPRRHSGPPKVETTIGDV